MPGEGSSQNQRQVEAIQTARKVVVVLHVLCFFPLFIGRTLEVLGYEPVNADMVFLFFFLFIFFYLVDLLTVDLIHTFISLLIESFELDLKFGLEIA